MIDEPSYCPFCQPDADRVCISENELAYATLDKFPVSNGHILVIPRRHCSNYFDLSSEEQTACWNLINELKGYLLKTFYPDGFNIGININEAAGQTIPHVHIHLIPRYQGDVREPKGGVRGVIPTRKKYPFMK